jgi:hypothetical protein
LSRRGAPLARAAELCDHGRVRGLWSLVLSCAIAGCSLVVDTKGLAGGEASPQPDGAAPDASIIDASTDAALSDARAPDATAALPPLIASWPFDEGNGSTVHDRSGNGHDGVAGAATWVEDRRGNKEAALRLDGTGVVDVPASPDFDRPVGASFTMTAWMKREGAIDHHMIVSVSYGLRDSSFGVELQRDDLLVFFDGVDHVATGPVKVDAGAWHHVAVTVTGATARTYFDGKPIGQTSAARDRERKATGVILGGSTYGDRFRGAIDDVKIFAGALSDAQIAAEAAN